MTIPEYLVSFSLQPAATPRILAGGSLSTVLHECCVTSIMCMLTLVIIILFFYFGTLTYPFMLSLLRVFFTDALFSSLRLDSSSVDDALIYVPNIPCLD